MFTATRKHNALIIATPTHPIVVVYIIVASCLRNALIDHLGTLTSLGNVPNELYGKPGILR